MDDKYQISKPRKPETKQEMIQQQIEELIKLRDQANGLSAKEKINAEIMMLYAQYERLKL